MTIINISNFDETHQDAVQHSRELGYYLDHHVLEGKDYWTVSDGPNIIDCFDEFVNALDLYAEKVNAGRITHDFKAGDFVVYNPDHGFPELGRVKSIRDNDVVFVVYNCNRQWDEIYHYTAAGTNIKDLIKIPRKDD